MQTLMKKCNKTEFWYGNKILSSDRNFTDWPQKTDVTSVTLNLLSIK